MNRNSVLPKLPHQLLGDSFSLGITCGRLITPSGLLITPETTQQVQEQCLCIGNQLKVQIIKGIRVQSHDVTPKLLYFSFGEVVIITRIQDFTVYGLFILYLSFTYHLFIVYPSFVHQGNYTSHTYPRLHCLSFIYRLPFLCPLGKLYESLVSKTSFFYCLFFLYT